MDEKNRSLSESFLDDFGDDAEQPKEPDGDVIEILEQRMLARLSGMADDGSVPAANAVLKDLHKMRARKSAREHKVKMQTLQGVELIEYLASIAIPLPDVIKTLGRRMKKEEKTAYIKAEHLRLIELRASSMAKVRAGLKPPDPEHFQQSIIPTKTKDKPKEIKPEKRRKLTSAREVSNYSCVSLRTVTNWRREDWWTWAKKGPVIVWSDELDTALKKHGIKTGPEIRAEKDGPDQIQFFEESSPQTNMNSIIDYKVMSSLPSLTGKIDDDIKAAREIASRLLKMVIAFKVEALSDPAVARLFGQYNGILSRVLGRISSLEARLIELKRKKSELLDIEEVNSIIEIMSTNLTHHLSSLGKNFVSFFKKREIEVYGESKIDAEELIDDAELIIDEYKSRVADGIESSKVVVVAVEE